MNAPKTIDLTTLSDHKRLLRVWSGVIILCLTLFFSLLVFSYFTLNESSATAHNTGTYRRGAAIFGALELECLAIAVLAFLRYRYIRGKERKRTFRQLLAANKWSETRKFVLDKVAATLLGPRSSFQEIEYAFHGKYNGQEFTCLILQFLTGDSRARRFICLSFRLPKSYPMIVIDNRLNDGGYRRKNSNLPDRIPKGVSFELEGDFSKYYSLSTIKGRERAAVQILSPDVMAALVDCAGNKVGIEISDKDLFLIYEADFYTARNVSSLFSVADIMLDKLGKLSKTWLASGGWEEWQVSQAARTARQKLISYIHPLTIIVWAVAFLLFVFAMVGNFMREF